MGLVELVIAGLCLNATCPVDDNYNILLTRRQQQFENLLKEIRNENFIIATIKNEKLSGLELANGSYVGKGVAFDILHILQKKYGFNYTVAPPTKENTWGSDKNGVLQMLKDKKANLAVAFLPYISKYADEITYSPSLDNGEWVVMMTRPRESATGSGLLAPFTYPVWILILVSVVVVGPIIHFIVYVQVRLCKEENENIYPLSSCCWFVYGALLKQGSTLNPSTDSARLLFATWWIFITVLTAFYTANLTAFLTLSKFTLPINEPKNIGDKRSKWITTKGNALEDSLSLPGKARDELAGLLGHPVMYVNDVDINILEDYVKKKDWLFLREKPIVEHVMYEAYKKKVKAGVEESKRCTYVFTDFTVTTYARAFAYAKDFKYRLLFDNTIQLLVQSGIIKFKLAEDLPGTRICPMDLGSKERQLRNTDLLLTYQIVGGGFVLSILVFFIEVLVRRIFFKNRKPKPDLIFKNTKLNPKGKNNFFGTNFNYVKDISQFNFITPPPPYSSLYNAPFGERENFKKQTINGREYWVREGDKFGAANLVPLRAPSALLFQYTN